MDSSLRVCAYAVSLAIALWSPCSCLKSCSSPLGIKSLPSVDYERLGGTWHVVGRDDVGLPIKAVWNGQVQIRMTTVDPKVNQPVWFTEPRGCCILTMDCIGRDEEKDCVGWRYVWGVSSDSSPGWLKHKLIGMAHYSLLFIVDTDYDDYAVIAHCRSKSINKQFFCSIFNIFLLKRRATAETLMNAAETFDTSVVQSRLDGACDGQVHFKSTRNNYTVCQPSEATFKVPNVYEINSL